MNEVRGKLLVATPDLVEPTFFRTVVLVLEHNHEGALGVVLNRPTDTPVAEALPAWSSLAPEPGVVFVGGPVQPDTAIVLGARRQPVPDAPVGFAPLFDDLGTVDLERGPDAVLPPLASVRVFVGYTGWGPGQLDGELAANGWFVVDREPHDLWCRDPSTLWRDVLRRQRGRVRFFAECPDDPSLN